MRKVKLIVHETYHLGTREVHLPHSLAQGRLCVLPLPCHCKPAFRVIANQSADWCGNLRSTPEIATALRASQ